MSLLLNNFAGSAFQKSANSTYFILFYCVLAFSFINDIAINWEYMGFQKDLAFGKIILSLIFLFALGMIVGEKEDVATFYQKFITFSFVCPSLIIYSLTPSGIEYYLALIMGVLSFFIFCKFPLRRLVVTNLSRRKFLAIMVSVSSLIILLFILNGGFKYFNLDLSAVYEYRRVAADALPGFFGYLLSPVAKVFLPIALVIAVMDKKWIIASLIIVLAIIFFGLTHHKTVFLAPFAVLIIYYALQKFKINTAIILLFFIISIFIICELVFRLLMSGEEISFFSSLFVRRLFLVSPLLDKFYVDFFMDNQFFYWSTSKIGLGLVDSPYNLSAPFMIGEEFFGRVGMSANAGFIGSGFANFGYFGVLIYGVVLGLIVSILNSHGKHIGHIFVISVSILVVMAAVSASDLTTVVFTHGLFFLLFILSSVSSEFISNE